MTSGTTVVILAAGKGTRMKSETPKCLHELCGRSMLGWVLGAAEGLSPDRIVVVVGHGAAEVEAAARRELPGVDLQFVLQEPQLGTGHALQVAAPALGDTERVVVTYGDMPLLSTESMQSLVDAQMGAGAPGAVSILTAIIDDPTGYGRIIRREDGSFERIVEHKDASEEERMVNETNLGVYCFDRGTLDGDLERLDNNNAQGEYYITDLVGMADAGGRPVLPLVLEDAGEAQGVNDLGQLAEVRWQVQMRILEQHMAAGVRIMDPATTFIDHGVEIGCGTEILPCTVIRSGVKVGEGCEVGPFTHLRAGAVLEDTAEVGNFTEMKNSTLGSGSKAKHLSYLGDTRIGAKANIGAGTIFANYDGKEKHPTTVGDGAFIGSGSIVVAPNVVPPAATTGAGAVITRSAEMQEGETWVGMPARKLSPKS
ncbi:MAG: bifunctional N-acetylglucosamine-1-phosphate uridyltransferase/glucosamine-1-phosphate acetyltransferase [Planctomycetes bacterium]|nr:bifunctional N-acetylglucosamine-1-phosphate uridyltransferase/glucosamine-1-phosphate acetyltransferase [Planctomycetota bacterium]